MYQAEKTKGKIYPSIHWEEAAPLRGGDYLFQYQKPCVPTSFWEYMLQDDEQAAPAAMIAVAQLCCHFLSQADPLEGMSSWAAEATGGYRLVVGWASTGKIVPNALWDNGRPTYVGLATIRRLA